MVADISGNLSTNGSALSFLTLLDGVRYEGRLSTEQVNAIANPYDNEVPLEDDDTFTLREIMRSGQAQCNLATIWQNTGQSEYAKIVMTRASNTRTFYALMESFRETGGRGKWTAELTFQFVDAGGDATANPAYA
jgi:hypothetical protein